MRVAQITDLNDLALLVLNRFSPRLLPSIARLFGDIGYLALRGQRRMIAHRLSAVLGAELTPSQIRRLTREHFRNRGVRKFPSSAFNGKTGYDGISIQGTEHLCEALDRGKGIILWESPFGKRLLAKVALKEKDFNICQVHDSSHGGSPTWVGQKIVRNIYRKIESNIVEIIDILDDSFAYLKPLINRLRQNGIVCVSGFGAKGQKFVPVSFLGTTQYFPTGTVSLAKMTGASLIPIFCFEEHDGLNRLVIEKPLTVDPNEDREKAAVQCIRQYGALLESYIVKYPIQWDRWNKMPTPVDNNRIWSHSQEP